MKTNPIRILYLDNHPLDRASVRDVLLKEPGAFDLIEAGSAGEFEALIRNQAIDLVLSDIDIPGLSCQDVLEMVQAFNAQLPVIILTGNESAQTASESIQCGAADHIVKTPASLGILEHKLRQVLEKKQADEKRRKSEIQYEEMAKRIPVGVYVSSLQSDGVTKFLYASPRFCEIFGLNEADVLADPYLAENVAHPEDREDLIRTYKYADEKGLPFSWEGRFIVEGKVRWIHMESEPYFLPDGDSLWNGVVVDITARKHMEKQIIQDEAIFTSFMENSPVYVFFKDKAARVLRLSSNYETMLGMPVSQTLGKSMDELFPSELSKSMVADDLRIINEGKRVDVIEELNGRTYETTKFPIFRDGKPEMLAGFTLDITERVQIARELHQAEALNQAIISQSPIGIATFNRSGTLLFGNPAWKRIWAFSEEAYQKELQHDFTVLKFKEGDAYLQDHQDQIRQVFAKGGTLYLPDLKVPTPRPGGAEWISEYYYALPDEQGQVERMVTLTEDISARKKIEGEIEKNRMLLERAQDVAKLGSLEIDLTTRTVVANVQARRIYGWEDGDLSLTNVQAVVLPEYRPELDAALEDLILQNKEYDVQYKIKRRSDGAIRDIHAIAEYNPAENTVVGSIQDITERKLIMQVLMENEEKFRTLFERANDMIVISNVNDRILDANQRACDLLGYNRDELLKMKVTDLQAQEMHTSPGTTLKDEFKKFGSKVFESLDVRKDGTTFPVEVTLSRISIAKGIRFIGIVRDISERKRIEKELREQIDILERINKATVDKELCMLKLKKEINALLVKAGEQEKYRVVDV